VQETASDKSKREYDKVAKVIAKAIDREELLDTLRDVLKEKVRKDGMKDDCITSNE